MSKKTAYTKVTPSLEFCYQGKVYDVSRLPVTVGEKLSIQEKETGVMVNVSGTDAWCDVPEVELDEMGCRIDKQAMPVNETPTNIYYDNLSHEEQRLLHGYRSLDDCDKTVIDYLMSVLFDRTVGDVNDE